MGDSRAEPSVTGRSDRTVLLIGKGEDIKAPNFPQECLLFTATQHSRLQETPSGWVKGTSRFLQLLSLWKRIELQTREDAMVEGPRNSCWCQVFSPCFCCVCFQWELRSAWLGAPLKRHTVQCASGWITRMTGWITLCATITPGLHPDTITEPISL